MSNKKTLYSQTGDSSFRNTLQNQQHLSTSAKSNQKARAQTPNQRRSNAYGGTQSAEKIAAGKENRLLTDAPQSPPRNSADAQKNPAEYYKTKSRQLQERVTALEAHNARLQEDLRKLRDINFDYVKHLNDIGERRQTKSNSSQLNTSERSFARRSRASSPDNEGRYRERYYEILQRIRQIEAEQADMIVHTKFMQNDIKNYKSKLELAEHIINEVKKVGAASVEELVQMNKKLENQLKEATYEKQDISLKHAIGEENIDKVKNKWNTLKDDYDTLRNQNEELVLKYNRLLSESEEKKKLDKNSIYQLRCRVEFLEEQLRGMQSTVITTYAEKQELSLKVRDVETQNKSLRNTLSNFADSTKTGLGKGTGFSVKFK